MIFPLEYVPQLTKCQKICFILIAQAYRSIDFDDLFASISTLTLSTDFTFCQLELRRTWYPLDAILLSNEYILLTCYDTKKLVLLKISVKRFPKQLYLNSVIGMRNKSRQEIEIMGTISILLFFYFSEYNLKCRNYFNTDAGQSHTDAGVSKLFRHII